MSKKTSFLVLLGAFVLPLVASAQLRSWGSGGSIRSLLDSIESIAWIVFGTIVVVCFVVAGVMFLTAQGQPEKIQLARSATIWGVAGVIVGILAYSIMAIMENIL